MGLLENIKSDIKKAGTNKGKIIFFRENEKRRIRFLQDMEEGKEIVFHDNFSRNINIPCQKVFGRKCPYCNDEDVRTRSLYAWSVWDYDAKEVKLFMFAVNNCSPIPSLAALYDTYGTLTDRDYVVTVTGKQQNKSYTVVPMDKVKFRNDKAKPFSESAMLKIIDKAYPLDTDGDDEDDEEERKPKPSKNRKADSKSKASDDWEGEEDESEENDYSKMSAKELFALCKERDISVPPKKLAKFYINQLEEYDKAQEDWGEEDEESEDDWEDEEDEEVLPF